MCPDVRGCRVGGEDSYGILTLARLILTTPWDSIDIRPGEYGTVRYRLVVVPPGVTGVERRLPLSETWPAWGAVLWLISEVGLSSALQPWAAFGISTLAYLGIEAALIGRLGALRLAKKGECGSGRNAVDTRSGAL